MARGSWPHYLRTGTLKTGNLLVRLIVEQVYCRLCFVVGWWRLPDLVTLDQCSVRRINRVLSRTSSDYPPIILGRRIGIPLIARSGTHESIGGSYDGGLDRSSPPASGIYGADDCSVRRKPQSVLYCSRYHLLTLSFRVTKTCLQLTSSCRPLCEDKRNEKAFHKIFECS